MIRWLEFCLAVFWALCFTYEIFLFLTEKDPSGVAAAAIMIVITLILLLDSLSELSLSQQENSSS